MDHLHAEKAVAALGRRHIGVGYLWGDSGESGARPGYRIGFEAAALPEHGVPHMIVERHGAQPGELGRPEPPHHLADMAEEGARKSVVEGRRVDARVYQGGRRIVHRKTPRK